MVLLIEIDLILIGILEVDAVVEVLVIKLFILSVEFTTSRTKLDQHIFVFHELLGFSDHPLLVDLLLSIKWAENDTSCGVVLQKLIVCGVDAMLSKLCVKVAC